MPASPPAVFSLSFLASRRLGERCASVKRSLAKWACLFCPCMEIYHHPNRTAPCCRRMKENLFSRRMLPKALSLLKELLQSSIAVWRASQPTRLGLDYRLCRLDGSARRPQPNEPDEQPAPDPARSYVFIPKKIICCDRSTIILRSHAPIFHSSCSAFGQ